jgi:KaiC/GvpD/RAD55 family RecA-like ATPase
MIDDRVPTGIPGLDELIQGGIPRGASILLSGGPGTGKTIFCLQYIYNGALKYNEPGIFISFEEGRKNLWWNVENFKWKEFVNLQKKGMIEFRHIGRMEPYEFAERFDFELEKIKAMVERIGAKRLVVDSTTAFAMWLNSGAEVRHYLFKLIDEMKKLGTTTILTCEVECTKTRFSRFEVEEFVVDGVISLFFKPPRRVLFIRKMRGTKQDLKLHPYEVTEEGIAVNPVEEIMWESLI